MDRVPFRVLLSSRLRGIVEGVEREPKPPSPLPPPPQIRRSRTDLSRETRATATNRREACWRQSGKSKVLDCHQGDCPLFFSKIAKFTVRVYVANVPI
jgi:hypothetical protein